MFTRKEGAFYIGYEKENYRHYSMPYYDRGVYCGGGFNRDGGKLQISSAS